MVSNLSMKLLKNALEDILRVKLGKTDYLKPLMFTYFVNSKCNYECNFCPYAKNGETKNPIPELSTEDTLALFRILKRASPHVYFSGGEPLLRPDIVELINGAKRIGFKSIMMVSNMSVIHRRMEVLENLTSLVASVNMLDTEHYSSIVATKTNVLDKSLENVALCAGLQKELSFNLTVNFVANAETLPHLHEVLDFCKQHAIYFTMGPELRMDETVAPELATSALYLESIEFLKKERKRCKLILDSESYFSLIQNLGDFDCYPTLIPRIYPNGDLAYPCKPLSTARVNLLDYRSYDAALREGVRRAGSLPMCKGKCFQNCYTQPSQLVKDPLGAIAQLIGWA